MASQKSDNTSWIQDNQRLNTAGNNTWIRPSQEVKTHYGKQNSLGSMTFPADACDNVRRSCDLFES